MNPKVKSLAYFASLVIAMVTYYTIGQTDTDESMQLAENSIEQVAEENTLNW